MGSRTTITLLALVLLLEVAPRAFAEGPPRGSLDARAHVAPSFMAGWDAQLATARATESAREHASLLSRRAADDALAYANQARDRHTLERGLAQIRAGHVAEGLQTLEIYLHIHQPSALFAQASAAAARAAVLVGQPERAIYHLNVEAAVLDGAATAQSVVQHAIGIAGGDPTPVVSDDILEGYRALWRAQAALQVQRWEMARDAADRAADNIYSPYVHHARFLGVEARLHIDDEASDAVSSMDRLLVRYPEYPQRDRMQVVLARAERRLGRPSAAARRLDEFLWDRPFSGRAAEAHALLETLLQEGGTLRPHTLEARLERGRQLRRARHWNVAEEILQEVLADAMEADARTSFLNEIRLQLSLNGYDSARFEDALAWMDAIEENGGAGVSQFNRATWRARPLSRLGREQEGYEVLAAYYGQRSGSERHYRMYEYAADIGMWDAALEHLDDRFGGEREWQSWDGAFTHYMAGNYERALSLFRALSRRASGTTQSRYDYWTARTLEHLDRVDEALEEYAAIAARYPYRYYGLQSYNRTQEWQAARAVRDPDGAPTDGSGEALPEPHPAPAPGRIHWEGFGGEPIGDFSALHVADLDEFFRGYPSEFDDTGALNALVEDWGEVFPDARTAQALWEIGAVEEARKEFRTPLIEFRSLESLANRGRRPRATSPIRLSNRRWAHYIDNRPDEPGWWGIALDELRYPIPSRASERRALAERQSRIQSERETLRPLVRAVARQLGDFYMVRRFALDDDLPSLNSEPLDIRWHEAYPRAYGPALFASIDRYQLNPFLVWALMIVESDMNPDTVSHADAYGLLQVIPKTGDLVALDFGQIDFGVHDLLEPSESLRYGTWYLNELLEKFHGQEMLAMVAYNAGPHQVQRWLEWRGDDMQMDEFIETVPYDGARRYPQRIVQYMSILRAVNALDRHVYIGNDLDETYEDNIYF